MSALDARVLNQSPAIVLEQLAENLLGLGVLRQDAAARHLGDVGRLEVDLKREAVHQARQLDAGGCRVR